MHADLLLAACPPLLTVLFLFQFFCGFSGQPLVDELSASAYNVVFTSLPPLVLALLDRQIGVSPGDVAAPTPARLHIALQATYAQARKCA